MADVHGIFRCALLFWCRFLIQSPFEITPWPRLDSEMDDEHLDDAEDRLWTDAELDELEK